ncbi:MAG: OmpA family protein [Bacteroidia bacterium]|nr:OmpA family protein [Bacteroidia bacterium]
MKTVHAFGLPLICVVALLLASCGGAREAVLETGSRFTVHPVTEANTAVDELAPVITRNGLYFVSDRAVADDEQHRMYLLPEGSTTSSDVVALRVEGGGDRAGAMHISNASLLFGQCYRQGGLGDCDLYEGRLSGDGRVITDVRLLPPPVNDIEWDHHPVVRPDGKMLVFASERIRGLGGSDLYMSMKGQDGWMAPVSLGEVINTRGNEITPSFSADGKFLYFASDSRNGYGGFDLYASEYDGKNWKRPKLLPPPFNSEDDDLFLCGGPEADASYVASNRDGGRGGYDLYRIERVAVALPPPPPEARPIVLRVKSVNAFTREAIPANITIADAGSDAPLAAGAGKVDVAVGERRKFSVTASHSGFMNGFEEVVLSVRDGVAAGALREGGSDVVERILALTPVTEDERKIFAFTVEFDFDLSDIRPEEEEKLDSAAVLLALYPNSTVVFSGHTDSLGTDVYNIKLGYNRASEVSRYVATYLRGKNVILRNPMEIRTYGETQPIASNATDEGRQRNRRVEIAIIRNE